MENEDKFILTYQIETPFECFIQEIEISIPSNNRYSFFHLLHYYIVSKCFGRDYLNFEFDYDKAIMKIVFQRIVDSHLIKIMLFNVAIITRTIIIKRNEYYEQARNGNNINEDI